MKLQPDTWRAFLERARATNRRRDEAIRARGLTTPVDAGAVTVARECMGALEVAVMTGDTDAIAETYALLESFVEAEAKKGGA